MSLFIKFYFTSSMLNMFRTLIHSSSGACDYSIVSPHWSCVLVSICVGVLVWLGWGGIRVAGWSNTDTTPTQPHRNSNTHRTKKNTTNVVIQENSRKLLMMDILMSETCWAHKKWNKGLLFFNYHNDARSNKHKLYKWITWYIEINSVT